MAAERLRAPSAMRSDEALLVERARRGDRRAFELLVQRHQTVAFRVAYLASGSSADASDVLQEALLKAYRAIGRFRPGAPFRPWLLEIVANEARNARRAAGRREHLVMRVLGATAGLDAPFEDDLVAAERREELLAAIARLRERDQLVIAYRYLLELSEAETASALAVPPGTVKSRLSTALARLRAELGALRV